MTEGEAKGSRNVDKGTDKTYKIIKECYLKLLPINLKF
jgi:hypothetical protein